MKWGLTTQHRVTALRAQIQFHIQKIHLLIGPVQLGLVRTIAENFAELRELQHREVHQPGKEPRVLALDDIPESVQDAFRRAFLLDSPTPVTTVEDCPLAEGIDACRRHYQESTVKWEWIGASTDAPGPTVEQHVNLLKAHWIIVTLKASRAYVERGLGSGYSRAIAQVEQGVVRQYERPELVRFSERFSEQEVGELDESLFWIWHTEPPRFPQHSPVSETPILELSLARRLGRTTSSRSSTSSSGPDLVLFHREGPSFRIAYTGTAIGSGETIPSSLLIDTHHDRIIPWYAAPKAHPMRSVGISLERDRTGVTYFDFKNDEDMFGFQQALTGYRVVYDDLVRGTLNEVRWGGREQTATDPGKSATVALGSASAGPERRITRIVGGPFGNIVDRIIFAGGIEADFIYTKRSRSSNFGGGIDSGSWQRRVRCRAPRTTAAQAVDIHGRGGALYHAKS